MQNFKPCKKYHERKTPFIEQAMMCVYINITGSVTSGSNVGGAPIPKGHGPMIVYAQNA